MAQRNLSPNERALTHIYVRDLQKHFIRPCWSKGSEVYCGICMTGTVQPIVGAVCPECSSRVERILESEREDAARPVRKGNHCTVHAASKHSGFDCVA
jgi:hypothetical protein